jgi:hypothetical protein
VLTVLSPHRERYKSLWKRELQRVLEEERYMESQLARMDEYEERVDGLQSAMDTVRRVVTVHWILWDRQDIFFSRTCEP